MKAILLTQGKRALVDDEDYAELSKRKWCATRWYHSFYAVRHLNKKSILPMHRAIMGLSLGDGKMIDHINRDTLDNRKRNLRVVTPSLNEYNKKKQSNNSSGYRGITWDKNRNKWQARVGIKGKLVFCGRFDNKIEAALAYDSGAIKYYGEDAILNFPKG